jgi:hypothetical protein
MAGFPDQVRRDLRAGKPRISDHPGADDMAEFDEPAACGRRGGDCDPRASPRPLMRFGKDHDIGKRDRVGHHQAKGSQERGNVILVHAGVREHPRGAREQSGRRHI